VRITGKDVTRLRPGEFAEVVVTGATDYDLKARLREA
jgi:hypothetical protein